MHAKQKGFTLIELLVVIAIIAIMAVIALPNMSQWIASRRVASNAEQIANLLRFARSEAVRLNLPVYVCPVPIRIDGQPNTKKQCENKTDAKSGEDYKDHVLIAFADQDNDKQYTRRVDISLRTVPLNHYSKGQFLKRVEHNYFIRPFGENQTSDSQIAWTFLPNGNFVRWKETPSKDKSFPTPSGYSKITLTDANASNGDKKARSTVLFIDGSGRVEICAKSDSRDICQYSEK